MEGNAGEELLNFIEENAYNWKLEDIPKPLKHWVTSKNIAGEELK